jgi:hypothetical protein
MKKLTAHLVVLLLLPQYLSSSKQYRIHHFWKLDPIGTRTVPGICSLFNSVFLFFELLSNAIELLKGHVDTSFTGVVKR